MEENRHLSTIEYEIREHDETKRPIIRGYALKFDQPSEDLGFIEFLDKDCLRNADMQNVVALLNHDSNLVLGRTGRNLTLKVDEVGLYFEVEPTETSYARDLIENMRQGLIDKCSFAFTLDKKGDEWRKRDDGKYERYIRSIKRLWDVSVVTTPAYGDTIAQLSQRALNENVREREVAILEMELTL